MPRRRISDTATATLDHWLDQLQRGQLSIGELPLAVEAWLHVGYHLGRESREPEIAQLERVCNRYYNLAFTTDPERRARIEARLSQALDTATEEQWDQIEADLRTMRGETSEQGIGRDTPSQIGQAHGRPQREAA